MATFFNLTMAGSSGTDIASLTPTVGTALVKQGTAFRLCDGSGAGYNSSLSVVDLYTTTTAPGAADYTVSADFVYKTTNASLALYLWARGDASISNGYLGGFESGQWVLYKGVSGTFTSLGTSSTALPTVGGTTNVSLVVSGTTITLKSGATTVISITDSTFASAGVIGLRGQENPSAGTTTTGMHIANLLGVNGLSGNTFTITPSIVGISVTKNLTLKGTGTSWVNGTTVFTPSGVSGVTVNSTTVSSSTSCVVNVTTSTTTGTCTLTESGTGSNTQTFSVANAFAANTTGVFWSPGSVSFDSSNNALMMMNGTYAKFNFTGTSLTFNVDLSYYRTNSITQGNWHKFVCSIDGVGGTLVSITDPGGSITEQSVVLATGLSAGTHTAEVWLVVTTEVDFWTPKTAIKLNTIQLSGTSVLSAPTGLAALRTKRAIVMGDSITQGYDALGQGSTVYPPLTFPQILLRGLNAEGGQIGNSGQGWVTPGTSVIPAFTSTYNFTSSGVSRTLSGLDYLIVCHGTNDASNVQATVTSWIASARALVGGSCFIILVCPYTSNSRNAEIKAAVTAAADSKCFAIDTNDIVPFTGANGGGDFFKIDSVHPYAFAHAWLGSTIAGQILRATIATGGGGTYNARRRPY